MSTDDYYDDVVIVLNNLKYLASFFCSLINWS